MNTLAERIQLAMREAGIDSSALAKACGVKIQSVYQWESGATKTLKAMSLMKAANALGVSQVWLATGKGQMQAADGNVINDIAPSRSFYYPEISEVQAGNAAEAIDLLQPGEGERHQSDAWAGPHGFWLRVRGSSMTSSTGLSLNEGMLVLVAPGIEPRSGQVIVAKLGEDVTLKQYVVDAGLRLLRPFNPAYPTQVMDEKWQLVGTVVDAKWPRSAF